MATVVVFNSRRLVSHTQNKLKPYKPSNLKKVVVLKANPQSTRQVTIPNLPCVRICLVGSRQVVKEANPVSGVLVKLRCLPNSTKLRVVATNNG